VKSPQADPIEDVQNYHPKWTYNAKQKCKHTFGNTILGRRILQKMQSGHQSPVDKSHLNEQLSFSLTHKATLYMFMHNLNYTLKLYKRNPAVYQQIICNFLMTRKQFPRLQVLTVMRIKISVFREWRHYIVWHRGTNISEETCSLNLQSRQVPLRC
jgi:hypothetical protein